MKAHVGFRWRVGTLLLAVVLVAWMAAPASAVPTFISFDPRLPNPDQPYVMEGNAVFDNAVVSGLELRITNPSQLDIPEPTIGGSYAFDSTFDVQFSGHIGIGLAPPVPVSGQGTAHVTGIAPGGMEPLFVFDTEMVALDLMGTSLFGDFMVRESPTQRSSGVTTVEGACFGVCPAVVLPMRISSFFDVFTELSIDGGATWVPSPSSVRLVQTPEPGSAWLVICGATMTWLRRRRRFLFLKRGGSNERT